MLVALVLVAPALPTVLDRFGLEPVVLGPVGRVLLAGAVSVLFVAFGLWTLYQVFALADR